ncbi:hypothetical protein LDENG_00245540, partial [Lucifuga dentata]
PAQDRKQTQHIKTSSRHSSKLSAVLLAVTLFLTAGAAALFFFSRHEKENPAERDRDLRHTLRQISGSIRAAIHLEGEYNVGLNRLEWKQQVDQYHAQGGLQLHSNQILIPANGLYFVYSQASFRISCHADDDFTSSVVHLSHTVQRWSSLYGNDDTNKSYRTILHSVRTACQRTDGDDPEEEGSWFSTIYTGGVFNLRKGDHLKTVMEEKLLPDLDEEPGKTFFGPVCSCLGFSSLLTSPPCSLPDLCLASHTCPAFLITVVVYIYLSVPCGLCQIMLRIFASPFQPLL